MPEIKLTKDELDAVQAKLRAEKDKLPADEAQLLEAILNKAQNEMISVQSDPSWAFHYWTYKF